MTRFASTANQTEATQPSIRLFVAVALDFASGVVRAHDGAGSITIGGNEFTGVGNFGGVELTEETVEIIARGIKLRLSGVDNSLLTTALTENYQGRSATVYLGFLNMETNALIDTPETLWEGRMAQMTISLGKTTGTLELSCEHRLRREPRIARYTHADQQLAYSGDRFFDLVAKIPGFQGTWGARGVANDGGSLMASTPFDYSQYIFQNPLG